MISVLESLAEEDELREYLPKDVDIVGNEVYWKLIYMPLAWTDFSFIKVKKKKN